MKTIVLHHTKTDREKRVAKRLRAVGAVHGISVTSRQPKAVDGPFEHLYIDGTGPNPGKQKESYLCLPSWRGTHDWSKELTALAYVAHGLTLLERRHER